MFFIVKDNACVCRMSENCKSLVLQDKCNIEIFLSHNKVITCNSFLASGDICHITFADSLDPDRVGSVVECLT